MNDLQNQVINNVDANAIETIRSHVPSSHSSISSDEVGEPYRFLSMVKRHFRELYKKDLFATNGHCVLMLADTNNSAMYESFGEEVVNVKDFLTFDFRNTFIVALDSSLSRIRYIVVDDSNPNKTFNALQTKIENEKVRTNAEIAHITIDFSASHAAQYYKHEFSDNRLVNLKDDYVCLSREEFESFSDKFHETHTELPLGYLRPWDNQKEFELMHRAEDRIKAIFQSKLSDKVDPENISAEIETTKGRIDLMLHSSVIENSTGPFIIEFKVLYPNNSPEKNRSTLCKGVFQARDYGKTQNAQQLYLFAFDARKVVKPISWIDAVAGRFKTIYKNYRMYNTTPQARDEEYKEMS